MLIALLGGWALAAPLTPCATPDLLQNMGPWSKRPSYAVRPPVGQVPKQDRDHFQAPHSHNSDNFSLRWGSSSALSEEESQAILVALEQAWQVEITELGHPIPFGSDTFRFNVYVADTGVEGPWGPLGDFGAAGWFYPDDGAGFPFVVLARATVADVEGGGLTAAHELYHAIQHVTGRYREAEGLWFWEATATWMESQVFPAASDYARFLYGYALLPHLPIDFHTPFESGQLEEYHAYGAFIFPLMLSETVADEWLIRDVWVNPLVEAQSPIEPLEMELALLGRPFEDVLFDFAVHNVGWDYEDGSAYATVLEQVPLELESDGDRFVDEYWERGSGQWEQPASELQPASMGSNLIRLWNPQGESLYVQLESDQPNVLDAALVVESGDVRSISPIELTSGNGGLELELTGSEERVTVVIAAFDESNSDEALRYGYRYYLGSQPWVDSLGVDSSESVDGGCGCDYRPSWTVRHWFWGAIGFSVLRVRRRSRPFHR